MTGLRFWATSIVPKGAGPFPVLVALHGGGWVQGVRGAFQYWGPYLAARGYALFAISYRLAKTGQKTFPHAVQDALAAVQFVPRQRRASSSSIRSAIGLMGASAGANLAASRRSARDAAVFKNGYPQDTHAAVSTKVKVLVGVYGVYDVLGDVAALSAGEPAREQHREIHRRVADRESPALFRRLADQLRDASPSNQHRRVPGLRDRGRPGRSAAPTPTRSCSP